MRNETFQRVLDGTPQETKDKIREYAAAVALGHSYMRLSEVLDWLRKHAYRGDRRFSDMYRDAVASCVERFCDARSIDGETFVPVWQIGRYLLDSEMRKLQADIVAFIPD